MIFRNVKMAFLLFTVVVYMMCYGSVGARANEALNQVASGLAQGNYKSVVNSAGKIITSKASADVVAKALLYRGIAYRNQGKLAQAIADFSNAEWVRKLNGSDLRRLYAERALAYDAVGQKNLAAKDRQLAGSKNIALAQRASTKNGISLSNNAVKQASVEASKSTTQELFGGLQNLFGFNNNQKQEQKIVIKKPAAQNGAGVVGGDGFREIPTLDSAEAKKNTQKLKNIDLPPEKKASEVAALNGVPSNSAWAAKRADEIKANTKARQNAARQNVAQQNQVQQNKIKSTDGLTTGSPVQLQPKKTNQGQTNVVGNFFNNLFGGGDKKEAPPVNPGDDVIVAEQVATQVQTAQNLKKPQKKIVAPQPKKRVVKKAPPKKPVKRTQVAAVSKKVAEPKQRQFYHVQLGAFGEAGAADKFVNRLNGKYKSLLGNKTAMVVETDLGQQRRQYRVYLGPYRSRGESNKTCKVLERMGMGCSIVE